jgi:hypothetical protein
MVGNEKLEGVDQGSMVRFYVCLCLVVWCLVLLYVDFRGQRFDHYLRTRYSFGVHGVHGRELVEYGHKLFVTN